MAAAWPDQPIMRTASIEHLDIRSPLPDLQSLRGAYVKNIERLEQSAEELSQGGSDIGEEIRRMDLEQRQSESRRSSIRSRASRVNSVSIVSPSSSIRRHRNDSTSAVTNNLSVVIPVPGRSRNASTSSYANSIVDVNNSARWGGYSPAAFVTSPQASSQSGSWSHASLSRVPSTAARSTRPAGMPEPVQEGKPLDSPLASPISHFSPTRQMSQRSWNSAKSSVLETAEEDVVSGDQESHGQPHEPAEDDGQGEFEEQGTAPTYSEKTDQDGRPATPPDRPPTTDTCRQARSLFRDFDGVHYSPTHDHSELDKAGPDMLDSEQQHTPRARPVSYGGHMPGENMVYYPASIPRLLNLPKRLSQLPAASVHAKRQSHHLRQHSSATSKSASWLPELNFDHGREEPLTDLDADTLMQQSRVSSGNTADSSTRRTSTLGLDHGSLASQLRASAFVEHLPVQHDVEMQGSSVVATLDSILAASATAPVTAFTDHQMAGHLGDEVYGHEEVIKRHTIAAPIVSSAKDQSQAKRASSIMNMFIDFGNAKGKKLQKRNSQMNLEPDADTLQDEDPAEANGSDEKEYVSAYDDEGQRNDALFDDEDNAGGPLHGQPTTLLAELRARKAHQKSRNLTAATAYPNGMHSTLLELDAVAQIEKRKRNASRINLAWEDPATKTHADEVDDDNVPLGVLYGTTNQPAPRGRPGAAAAMSDRPLGLLERKEMEDNEPLSRRRDRLLGVGSDRAARERGVLDAAQDDGANNDDKSTTWADQVLGPFGGLQVADAHDDAKGAESGGNPLPNTQSEHDDGEEKEEDEEEETLGQRRLRLQQERAAQTLSNPTNPSLQPSSNTPASRPALQPSTSLANLLSVHPSGPISARPPTQSRTQAPPGSLLAMHSQADESARRNLRMQTARMSSHHPGPAQQAQRQSSLQNPRPALQTSASLPVGMGGNGYLAGGGAGMRVGGGGAAAMTPMGMGMQSSPYGQPYGHQSGVYGQLAGPATAYQGFAGQPSSFLPQAYVGAYPAPAPGMGLGQFGHVPMMSAMELAALEPAQRDSIQRWRLSVAQ